MSDRRSILLLGRTTRREAGNVAQHIDALVRLSRHEISAFNPVDRPDACALLDLDEFDVVVVHYTIVVTVERYLPAVLRDKISRFGGLKVQFIQDEYRWIDAITARMRELGIGLLFTCVPEGEVPKVYGGVPGLHTVTTLPGFVPEELVGRATPPLAERPLDIGYRGRTIPYWLGRLAYEKVGIGTGVAERAPAYGLRVDISSREDERIYGEAWNRFVSSCRATLGTESGASIADFDGSVERAVKQYLARHGDATFEDVERDVLAPYEGNVVINTVSPRVFEAAALRTAMILFPGEYSGTVEPWTHYLPLAKDFSNMDEIVERLRDTAALETMTTAAYDHLVASGDYSLARFVAQFDDEVAARSEARGGEAKTAYRRAALRRRLPPARPPARLRASAGRLAQPVTMAALVARDRPVRRLALALAHDRVVRNRATADDLWKLAALRRSVLRGLFHVVPTVEDGGRRLVLSSQSGSAPPDGHASWQGPPPQELIWNHSLLGETVPLIGYGLLSMRVGHHGIEGAHAFDSIVAAWSRHPELTRAALEPLLRNGPGNETGAPAH